MKKQGLMILTIMFIVILTCINGAVAGPEPDKPSTLPDDTYLVSGLTPEQANGVTRLGVFPHDGIYTCIYDFDARATSVALLPTQSGMGTGAYAEWESMWEFGHVPSQIPQVDTGQHLQLVIKGKTALGSLPYDERYCAVIWKQTIGDLSRVGTVVAKFLAPTGIENEWWYDGIGIADITLEPGVYLMAYNQGAGSKPYLVRFMVHYERRR